MTEEEFEEAMHRAIPRRAANGVRRGQWKEEDALEAARAEYAGFYPQGLHSPGHTFLKVVDEETGARVGETWYVAEPEGGKIRFWINWIWIDPEFRRRGYAKEVLAQLGKEASRRGADRIGLYVFADNPNAIDLYSKLGFVTQSLGMVKPLEPPG